MKNLSKYAEWLTQYNQDHPYSCRPDTPVELNVKTLWIPQKSDNRCAVIDLNHQGCYIEKKDGETKYYGANGNCNTVYQILEIPNDWTDQHIEKLAEIVSRKLDKPKNYPCIRALKFAGDRMVLIQEALSEMT